MDIKSDELKMYVNSALQSIKDGVESAGKFYVSGPIKFDLAVPSTKEGGGGLKIYVANAEGKLKSEEISKLQFEVREHREAKIINMPNL